MIAKPNAGMPVIDDSGNAVYSMHAEDFARHMKVLIESGASVVGGCCGVLLPADSSSATAQNM